MSTIVDFASPGYDPYADTVGDTGWFGSDVVKGIGKAAKSVAKSAKKIGKNSIVKNIVAGARTALKNSGPIGMVANGAISAMDAGLSGKNIGNIALAAAQGAAPSGIDTALNAGVALAKGEPVLNTALKTGAQAFLPGSSERFAYSVAADALKKGATKVDLGNARRALATEGQRRAFDAAVGTVANTVKKVKKKMPVKKTIPRPMSAKRPGNPVVKIQPRGNVKNAARTPVKVQSHSVKRVPWRRLSPRAAKFILSRVPMASKMALSGSDTGALAGGAIASSMPTVRNGSTGAAVSTLQATLNAKRNANLVVDGKFGPLTLTAVKAFQATSGLVVDGIVGPKTWAALDAAGGLPITSIPSVPTVTSSTSISRPTLRFGARGASVSELQVLLNAKQGSSLKVDGIFGSATLTAVKAFQKSRGLVVDGIVGPKTWAALDAAPVIKALPATPAPIVIPALPTTPIAIPSQSTGDATSIIQAKSILVAWSKTDGMSEAGLTDYGARPEDLSASFTSRDKLVCASFASWNNRTQGTSLSTGGDLTPAIADALRLWAEKRAATALGAPVVSTVPSAVPSVPQLPAVIASPGLPVLSSGPEGTVIQLPTDTITATPPTVAVKPTEPTKDNTLVLAGGGAALGYMVGGPVGALIGAAAGAIGSSIGKSA